MSNNNEKDDNLTVSRVYSTLQSPTFLKNLYWNILSDIKEKNTYKLMRGIAEKLINQNLEVLNGLSNNASDNMRRKTIVAEICSMSYTIDTIFSKILYCKLEKACKGQILSIIQQLRSEGKIPESVWSEFKVKTQIPNCETSTETTVAKTTSALPKKEVSKTPTRVGTRKRKVNPHYFLQEEVKKVDSNKEILEDLRKVNGVKETDVDENICANNKKGNFTKKKLGGRIKEFKKENVASLDANPSLKLTKENVSLLDSKFAESSSTSKSKDSPQSDNEACNISIASISSVHTSDLSSFDDEISLSSDDENGEKKKLPLKEAIKKFSKNDDLDSSLDRKSDAKSPESKEKPNGVTENKTKRKKISMDDTARSNLKSDFSQSQKENGLSKRTRKPNSRYSSANIFCPVVKVKERKKTATTTNNKANEKTSSDELSPQTKKSKIYEDNDIIVDVVTITQSINNEGSHDTSNDVKTSIKQPVIPDVYKSHSANRSLTSRRTAPVTLFST